jgi:hypothetical protein
LSAGIAARKPPATAKLEVEVAQTAAPKPAEEAPAATAPAAFVPPWKKKLAAKAEGEAPKEVAPAKVGPPAPKPVTVTVDPAAAPSPTATASGPAKAAALAASPAAATATGAPKVAAPAVSPKAAPSVSPKPSWAASKAAAAAAAAATSPTPAAAAAPEPAAIAVTAASSPSPALSSSFKGSGGLRPALSPPKVATAAAPVPAAIADLLSEERPIGGGGKGGYDLSALEATSAPKKWAPPAAQAPKPAAAPALPAKKAVIAVVGKPPAGAPAAAPAPAAAAEAPAAKSGEESGGEGAPPADTGPIGDRWSSKSAGVRRAAVAELVAAVRSPGAVLTPSQSAVLGLSNLLSAIGDGTQLVAEAGIQLAAGVLSVDARAAGRAAFLADEAAAGALVKALVAKAFPSPKTPLSDSAVDAVVALVELCPAGLGMAVEELLGALKGMTKPKVVRASARALTRAVAGGALTRHPAALKPTALIPCLPTILLCADKAVSAAGLEFTTMLSSIPGPFPPAIRAMVKEYIANGGFSADLAASILEKVVPEVVAADGAGAGDEGEVHGDPLEAEWAAVEAAAGSAPLKDVSKAVNAMRIAERMSPDAEHKETKAKMKWGDRVKVLEDLVTAITDSPRIAGDAGTFVDTLAGLRLALKDTNAAVVAKAIVALTDFASRLRSSFATGARNVLSDVLSRLREKRGAPQLAAVTCLRTMIRFESVSIEDVFCNVAPGEEGWKKAPLDFRRNLLGVAAAVLAPGTGLPAGAALTGSSASALSRVRAIVCLVSAGLADFAPEVKGEAERVLACALLRTGGGPSGGGHPELLAVLESLEKDYKASAGRVEAMVASTAPLSGTLSAATAAIMGKTTAPPPAAPVPAVRGRSAPPATGGSGHALRETTRNPVPTTGGRPAGIAAPAPAAAAAPKPSSAAALSDVAYEASIAEEPGSLPVPEDASETLLAAAGKSSAAYTGAMHGLHDSNKWQERKSAVEALSTAVAGMGRAAGPLMDAAVSFLSSKTASWTPAGGLSNAVLLVAITTSLEKMATACTSPTHFTRRAAGVVLDGLLPYLREKKGSDEIGRLASRLAITSGPNFVASRLVAVAGGAKATPGIMAGANTCLATLIETHGVGRISALHVLPHLAGPAGVQATQPAVKGPAIKALTALYVQLGPVLTAALFAPAKGSNLPGSNKWGITEMQVKTIEAEFAKAPYEAGKARALLDATVSILGESAPPSVRLHGEAAADVTGGGPSSSSPMGNGDREDVLSLLPDGCLTAMDCEAVPKAGTGVVVQEKPWQVRMAAVEAAGAALTAAANACPGAAVAVNENATTLLKALKRRLADVQANVKPRACAALAALAKGAGPGLAPAACRTLVAPLLDLLGDKKAGLKDAAVAALDAIVAAEVGLPTGAAPVHAPALVSILGVVNSSGVLGGPAAGGALGGTMAGGESGGGSSSGDKGTGVGAAGSIREQLMPWIAANIPHLPKSTAGAAPVCAGLVPAALECATDRMPAVRKAAAEVMAHLVRVVGPQALTAGLAGLRDAQRLAVAKAVDEAVATGKAMAVAAAGPKAGAKAKVEAAPAAVAEEEGTSAGEGAPAPAKASILGVTKVVGKTAGKPASGKAAAAAAAVNATRKLGLTLGPGAATAAVGEDSKENAYALLRVATLGKKAREKETSVKAWELRTSGEGSSDLPREVERLSKSLRGEFERAKVVSEGLMSDLFPKASLERGPDPARKGLEWLAATITASTASHTGLEAVRDASDLLAKLAALTLFDPRARPVLLSAASKLVDALLGAFEVNGWELNRYEGDVLVPALAERVGEVGAKGPALLHRTLVLLRGSREYQTGLKGVPDIDSYAAVSEAYLPRRIFEVGAKAATRAALIGVLGGLVACRPGAEGLRTVRKHTLVALSRLLERDGGMEGPLAPAPGAGAPAAKPAPAEVRAALLDLLGELYIAGGKDGARLASALSSEGQAAAKGKVTRSLSSASTSLIDRHVKVYSERKGNAPVRAPPAIAAPSNAGLADSGVSITGGRLDEAALAASIDLDDLTPLPPAPPVPAPRPTRASLLSPARTTRGAGTEMLIASPELYRDLREAAGAASPTLTSPLAPTLKSSRIVVSILPPPLPAAPAPSAFSTGFLGGLNPYDVAPTCTGIPLDGPEGAKLGAWTASLRSAVRQKFSAASVATASEWLADVTWSLFDASGDLPSPSPALGTAADLPLRTASVEALTAVARPLASTLALVLRGWAAWAGGEWTNTGPGVGAGAPWPASLSLLDGLTRVTRSLLLHEPLVLALGVGEVGALCEATLALAAVKRLREEEGARALRASISILGRRVSFRARRDHVLVTWTGLLSRTAKWSPLLGEVRPVPPLAGAALNAALQLAGKVPTYEWKYKGSENRLLGAGAPGSGSKCDLDAIALALVRALDEPLISARARRILLDMAGGGDGRGAGTMDAPRALLPGAGVPAELNRMSAESVHAAVWALLSLFRSLTLQLGLALEGPLRRAGAGPERLPSAPLVLPLPSEAALVSANNTASGRPGSFTRALYHAYLTGMAREQGATTLAGVRPVVYSREGGASAARAIAEASTAAVSSSSLPSTILLAPTPGKPGQGLVAVTALLSPASGLLELTRRRVEEHLLGLVPGSRGHEAVPFDATAMEEAGAVTSRALLVTAQAVASTRKDPSKAPTFTPSTTSSSLSSTAAFAFTTNLLGLAEEKGGTLEEQEQEEEEAGVAASKRIAALPPLPASPPTHAPVTGIPRPRGAFLAAEPAVPPTPVAAKGAVAREEMEPVVVPPTPVVTVKSKLPLGGAGKAMAEPATPVTRPAAPKWTASKPAKAEEAPKPGPLRMDDLGPAPAPALAQTVVPPSKPAGGLGASSRLMPSTSAVVEATALAESAVHASPAAVPLLKEQATAGTAASHLPEAVRVRLEPLLAALVDASVLPNAAVKDRIGELGSLALEVCTPLPASVVTAIATAVASSTAAGGERPDMTRICPFTATVLLALGTAACSDASKPFVVSTRSKLVITNLTAWAKARGGKSDPRSARLPLTVACDAIMDRLERDKKAAAKAVVAAAATDGDAAAVVAAPAPAPVAPADPNKRLSAGVGPSAGGPGRRISGLGVKPAP